MKRHKIACVFDHDQLDFTFGYTIIIKIRIIYIKFLLYNKTNEYFMLRFVFIIK